MSADPWMLAILVFAATLVLAALLSALSARSILSAAVLFLAVGFLCGPAGLGIFRLRPDQPLVGRFVEFALFSVLFTEGMRVNFSSLRSGWQLPARSLVIGIPVTALAIALFARWAAGLDWLPALLVGAALSPTDPVFAAAVVGHEKVPRHVRQLLNVESGFNDGLALPLVLVLLAVQAGNVTHWPLLLGELLGGVGIGLAVPWLVLAMERLRVFEARQEVRPVLPMGIALLVLASTELSHTNVFLGAFTAGIFVGTADEKLKGAFAPLGELIADIFKFSALLVFGALLTGEFPDGAGWGDVAFVALVLFVARPLALAVSLMGSRLSWREWITAAWFGPRGFASVFFGLLILRSDGADSERVFHLLAMTIAASMVAHSSTDFLVAHWFQDRRGGAAKRRDEPADRSS